MKSGKYSFSFIVSKYHFGLYMKHFGIEIRYKTLRMLACCYNLQDMIRRFKKHEKRSIVVQYIYMFMYVYRLWIDVSVSKSPQM